LPSRATSTNDSAAARSSVQQLDEASIDLHANLFDYTELEIAKELARHSVEMGLPNTTPPVQEGKMQVVGIKAVKIASTKAVLIVAFTLTNPGANNFLTLAFAASHAQRQQVA